MQTVPLPLLCLRACSGGAQYQLKHLLSDYERAGIYNFCKTTIPDKPAEFSGYFLVIVMRHSRCRENCVVVFRQDNKEVVDDEDR